MRKHIYLMMLLLITLLLTPPLPACDDTLVMLLTAQNPSSEFSRVMRNFSTDLTILGTALKAREKANFEAELAKVMESWLEFSKRYMTAPPPEARNDLRWAAKAHETAKSIGEIRRLVLNKSYMEAHDKILELNSRIGIFFEAFGVSEEKQLFISTSANLTSLERALLNNEKQTATDFARELEKNLASFWPLLKTDGIGRGEDAKKMLQEIISDIDKSENLIALDSKQQQLQLIFEEMRSQILLHEWFPGLDK
jgi:hypothetical protein